MSTTHARMDQLDSFGHDGPFPFERRQAWRWADDGKATALVIGGNQFGVMHEWNVIDCANEGMGALSDRLIHPGTVVSIGFDKPGRPARRGVVTRCLPAGTGYRVGVRYEGRLAA
jgi:hypothetical protein